MPKHLKKLLKSSFPESNLVKCMLFLNPCNVKPPLCDMKKNFDKFSNHINSKEIEKEYTIYTIHYILYFEDDAVKTLFTTDHLSSNIVKLWSTLYK